LALTALPAEGRKGHLPDWPLSKATMAEQKVWQEVWTCPQAVAWERLGWLRTVARFVRLLVQAEKPKAPVMVNAEARQLEDRLGLTPMSMLRLRWEITADEVAEARVEKAAPVRRLAAVDPEAAAN
jgi:cell envelope opacity-associated protein A